MKEIRLTKLVLNNFKGLKWLELDAGGKSLSVYGDNGTGKTTIADAFSWLLFGKDSAGRSDFDIKTLDTDGKPIHFLDHSVAATISVDYGEYGSNIELEKIYREKWVRQRGSVDREFQGHETEYLIDGIPKSKAEYTAFIKGIVDEDIFRLLTNPMYFNNNLDKKARRTMLFDVFGDVADPDVIAANFALLGDLTELIGSHTLDELKTATAQKKRRLSADLQAIPNRIDEASRFINDSVKESPAELEAELAKYREMLTSKEEALREVNTDTAADEYRRKAREEIRELEEAVRGEISRGNGILFDKQGAVDIAESELSKTVRKIADAQRDLNLTETRIHNGNKMLEQLRKEWQETFNKKRESDDRCPTCNQPLPSEQIEAAVAQFNANKAEELDRINAEAESIKRRIAEYEGDIERTKAEIIKLEEEREHLEKTRNDLSDDVAKFEKEFAYIKEKHQAAIDEKKNALAEWENSRSVDATVAEVRESLESEIAAIKANIRAIEGNISTLNNNEMFRERVKELTIQAKKLSGEYEALERTEYLIGEFTRLKASMLEEKINSKFKYAKFKLFETQINGGILETCEVTYNGVPYSVLNNAMKINIGLDIINAFAEAHGVTSVIFLDNAESVTEIFGSTSQLIKLYVSAADDALRVEKDNI